MFLKRVFKFLARTMWLRMMRLYSVYAIFGLVTSSTMWQDKGRAEAVVRDSSERRLVAVYLVYSRAASFPSSAVKRVVLPG
jgi:hypothetical protein